MDMTKAPVSATACRRQRQIEDCLYENLLHRPYTSVSISDLCHQMGLSRKSFYNYYPDKDACFRAIIKREIQSCMLQLASHTAEDHSSRDAIAAFLSFCRTEKVFFDIITRNNLVMTLMDQCIHYIRDEDKVVMELLNTDLLKNDPYVLSCYVSVNITFILQWHLENFATPLEDMIQKYQRLLYEPLLVQKQMTK
jgi:AcrR family transcriptional regulator